jgi:hypothetical protein
MAWLTYNKCHVLIYLQVILEVESVSARCEDYRELKMLKSPRLLPAITSTLLVTSAFAQTPAPEQCDCYPVDGQPAADVLASEDAWGNPTFIGGITNKGPNTGSVW